jgi:diacylglycerol O-acyltransferase / wax synthase
VRTPVANVDSAWLRMDEATNRMVVTGLLVLDRPVPMANIRRVIEERLLRFPRFTERIVDAGGAADGPTWERDPSFSLDAHFFETALPPPADQDALQAFVSELMQRPFDPDRPPWQFYFVPDYEGGCAIVGRIHHCIGDGLALIYVMLRLSDDGAGGAASPGGLPAEWPAPDAAGAESAPSNGLGRALSDAISAVARAPGMVAGLLNPWRVAEATAQLSSGLASLGRLLTMSGDPATPLRGPLGLEKRAVWSRAIPVDALKAIGRATGSTINDVLMSSVAGALRRYMVGHPVISEDLAVRGVVPVNLRPIEEAHRLGNQFGLVFLELPLGIEDPLERLFEVRRRMNALKQSPEAVVTYQILRAIGAAPRQLFDFVVDVFGRKATAVVTNVIGPRQPIGLGGAPLRQAMFWVPCAGRLGLGISLLSYAGHVWLGIQSDAGLVPDPERVLEGFYAEIHVLQGLRLVSEPAEPDERARAGAAPGVEERTDE